MQRPEPLEKTSLISKSEGCKLWATNDYDVAILEFESEAACNVAVRLQELVRKHALMTNFIERGGATNLIVRSLEPIGLKVVARTTANDTQLSYEGSQGQPLEMDDVVRYPGATPSRREMMEDTATHVARSLRAHLADDGVTDLTVRLEFGLGGQGECLLQVINPLLCDFGNPEMSVVYAQLGGGFGGSAIDVPRPGT